MSNQKFSHHANLLKSCFIDGCHDYVEAYHPDLITTMYQMHFRFYLDEYPKQKELRRNWLGDWYSKNKWCFQLTDTMKNFSDMIGVAGFIDDNFPDWSTETVSGCKFYDFQMKFAETIVDRYHERRWLRRN